MTYLRKTHELVFLPLNIQCPYALHSKILISRWTNYILYVKITDKFLGKYVCKILESRAHLYTVSPKLFLLMNFLLLHKVREFYNACYTTFEIYDIVKQRSTLVRNAINFYDRNYFHYLF